MAHSIDLIFYLVVALLISQSTQHFLLNYPSTIGFDDSLEASPPCGSFVVDFSKDNVTDFHIGGDALAMTSVHPQATWLFRATLDKTATGNWTTLLPPITQTGLGDYCQRDVMVPNSFAGQQGVIQVVQDAPDGILYQCAAVNFVMGTVAAPSICTNVTGLSAVETSDPALSSLPATATGTQTMMGSPMSTIPTGTSTASSATTTNSSKASTINFYGGLNSLGWFVMVASAVLLTRML